MKSKKVQTPTELYTPKRRLSTAENLVYYFGLLLTVAGTTTTTSQQMVVAAEAINRIESNPILKKRVINAVKEGGLAAFEKAIDNPAGAFIVGAIKGWQEVEAED
ncbi:hypothetical protein LC609_29990 [Nostoc sp. XA013]|nr:hypothetical protein [Nostoc sp. XA013]